MKQDVRPRAPEGAGFGGPLALALLVLLFYWKVLFGGFIFVFVDASRFFFPLWKWGAEAFRQGWIPLWNPAAQFGTPYLADPQTACAYPPLPLLYFFLKPIPAFAAVVILHHLWALWGFWFFARHRGYSRKASFLGACAFGFSLHVVCSSWTPPALMAISWIPWIFLSAEKVMGGERGGFLGLSLSWALQLACGYPVLVYLTGLALGMHLVWETALQNQGPSRRGEDAKGERSGGGSEKWKRFFPIFGAGALAVLYNLAWGLPFAEFFRLSNYGQGAKHFQELGFLDLGTALSPFDQGHPLLPAYHGPHYWVSTYFMGLPVLCLLAWGGVRLLYRRVSWGVFLSALVLSVGALRVGRVLMHVLPGYSLVIHSGFWISLVVFWAAWMAMESAEAFLGAGAQGDGGRWPWVLWALLIYAVSLAFRTPLFPEAFGASLGLLAAAAFAKRPGLRWSLLFASLALSLGTSAVSLNILLPRSYYSEPPKALTVLDKPGRIFFTPPLLKQAVRLQGSSMEQAYETAKQRMYPDWPLAYFREEAPVYNTLQLKSSFDWTFKAFRYSDRHSRNVLDYLDVRYVVGKNRLKGFRRIPVPGDPVEVSENGSPMPKWFSVQRAVAGDAFQSPDAALVDYRKECFVADPSLAGAYRPRRVQSRDEGPDRVLVTAEGRGKAFLASSETDYPGWKARVGGAQRPVALVNNAFRGIRLADGETGAVLSYEPDSFRLGLFLALLACGFWSAWFLIGQIHPGPE